MNETHFTVHDFEHDGELYQNKCVYCGVIFLGHKHRNGCKVCVNQSPQLPNTLQPRNTTLLPFENS